MNIINILREHLTAQVADGAVSETHYGWAEQFNNVAGRCQTPVSFLVTPTKWKLNIDTVRARESGVFVINFLDKQPQLDFDAVANEAVIDSMIDVAVDLVGRLRSDTRIRIEDVEVDPRSIYDANNKNLTGVQLALRIIENKGRCIPTKPIYG